MLGDAGVGKDCGIARGGVYPRCSSCEATGAGTEGGGDGTLVREVVVGGGSGGDGGRVREGGGGGAAEGLDEAEMSIEGTVGGMDAGDIGFGGEVGCRDRGGGV